MILNFYTDGAVKENKYSTKKNCLGGIGIFCQELNLEISQAYPNATNNIMELKAILECIKYVISNDLLSNNEIVIHSDSQYSINCCTVWYKNWNAKKNGWKDKKNPELIKEISSLLETHPNIKLKWVKGHSGVFGNEKADYLANKIYM